MLRSVAFCHEDSKINYKAESEKTIVKDGVQYLFCTFYPTYKSVKEEHVLTDVDNDTLHFPINYLQFNLNFYLSSETYEACSFLRMNQR